MRPIDPEEFEQAIEVLKESGGALDDQTTLVVAGCISAGVDAIRSAFWKGLVTGMIVAVGMTMVLMELVVGP